MALPTILAVDTATEVCSVALLIGARCIERCETVGNGHSLRILPMVDEVLAESGAALAEIDAIAFGAGPGSFTGLRIACGIAQGLAWSAGKRVVPVGNLRALAACALSVQPTASVVLSAIDARMQEAYCAVYRREHQQGQPGAFEMRTPTLEAPRMLAELAGEMRADVVAGNALAVFAEAWPLEYAWLSLPELRASAVDIARLARGDALAGLALPPQQALPVYVRDQVALTIDERRQRRTAVERARPPQALELPLGGTGRRP